MRGFGLSLAALVVILDQLSKWWITAVVMNPPREIEVTSFFNLVMAWNRGISFSLFRSDWGAGPYLWSGLAVAVAIGLAWWLGRVHHRLAATRYNTRWQVGTAFGIKNHLRALMGFQ